MKLNSLKFTVDIILQLLVVVQVLVEVFVVSAWGMCVKITESVFGGCSLFFVSLVKCDIFACRLFVTWDLQKFKICPSLTPGKYPLEGSTSRCPEVFLEISQNSQENTCARVCFLTKLKLYDPGTGVFLCILGKFFLQNTSGGCFWEWYFPNPRNVTFATSFPFLFPKMTVNYFHKKLHLRSLNVLWMRLWKFYSSTSESVVVFNCLKYFALIVITRPRTEHWKR